MKKDNHLTTSGLIVTIAFTAGILAAVIGALAVNMRSRTKAKREAQVAAMMASSIPAGRDVERSVVPQMRSDDNLPLIAPGGQRSQGQYYNVSGGAGEEQEMRSAPRLHQGLGALGQDQPPRY